MTIFSFTPEWRQEHDSFYVLATGGTDEEPAVSLATAYKQASYAYNEAQIVYNYRITVESDANLEAAKQAYIAARRALIEFIKTKHEDFVDPDL